MIYSTRSRFLILFAALLLAFTSTTETHAADDRVFTVRGIVRAPIADGEISIQHEEIPGFMPAMTMPFYVDEAEGKALQPGDKVVFEFRVGENSRATKFRKIGREEPAGRKGSVAAPGRRLRDGDALPDITLIDQDGRKFDNQSLQGSPAIITFVFTRCPVPEFCPLMGRNFKALQEAIAARPEGDPAPKLVSITIDPAHDTPQLLREYGTSLGADFKRWTFATGTEAEIARLAKLFAVRIEQNATTIDHTLATAVIDEHGRIVEIFRGNAWKPDKVLHRALEQ